MTIPHTSGTITLTQNSAVITGTLTGWQTAGITGGIIYPEAPGGNPLPIWSINSDTEAVSAVKWKGATGTYPYALVKDTAYLKTVDAIHTKLLEVITDLDTPSIGALAAIAGTLGAGKVPRGLNNNSMEWFTVSDFAKSLLDDGNAAAMRATLGDVFSKNRPISNDVLSGDAADFNALPGPGLWTIERGSNLFCLNSPPDVSKFAYRAIQIGDSGRGSLIAFNFNDGAMWIRNGYNGWGAWRLVASSYQSTTVGAAGGSETDVGTSGSIKLDVTFVARATNIFAAAKWAYGPSISAPLEMITNLVLRDVTLGIDVKAEQSVTTLTTNDNGLGFRGNLSGHLSYNTLTVGNTYQLQLVMWKSIAIGPIYPRSMSINGLLF